MTPAGCRVAFAALDLDIERAQVLFGRSERTVFYWLEEGPPPHIEFALRQMIDGRLPVDARTIRSVVTRCRSRRDGSRYRRR
jgi:hypothetical protein